MNNRFEKDKDKKKPSSDLENIIKNKFAEIYDSPNADALIGRLTNIIKSHYDNASTDVKFFIDPYNINEDRIKKYNIFINMQCNINLDLLNLEKFFIKVRVPMSDRFFHANFVHLWIKQTKRVAAKEILGFPICYHTKNLLKDTHNVSKHEESTCLYFSKHTPYNYKNIILKNPDYDQSNIVFQKLLILKEIFDSGFILEKVLFDCIPCQKEIKFSFGVRDMIFNFPVYHIVLINPESTFIYLPEVKRTERSSVEDLLTLLTDKEKEVITYKNYSNFYDFMLFNFSNFFNKSMIYPRGADSISDFSKTESNPIIGKQYLVKKTQKLFYCLVTNINPTHVSYIVFTDFNTPKTKSMVECFDLIDNLTFYRASFLEDNGDNYIGAK